MRSAHPLTATVFLAIAVSGCGTGDGAAANPAGVTQSADAMEASVQESSLLLAVAQGLDAPLSAPDRIGATLDRARLQTQDFYSAQCVRLAERVGSNQLRVTLRNCNARVGGLRAVTGQILYTFTLPMTGGLRVRMQRDGDRPLRIGAAEVTAFDTTALLQVADRRYNVTIESSAYTAVGARGQVIERLPPAAGDPPLAPLSVSWAFANGGCFEMSGQWKVLVGPSRARLRRLRLTIDRYRRCPALCPAAAADSVVVVDETPDRPPAMYPRFSLSFLGGNVAQWSSDNPDGMGTVMLTCVN